MQNASYINETRNESARNIHREKERIKVIPCLIEYEQVSSIRAI